MSGDGIFFGASTHVGPGSVWQKVGDNGFALRFVLSDAITDSVQRAKLIKEGRALTCSEYKGPWSTNSGLPFVSELSDSSDLSSDLAQAKKVTFRVQSFSWDELDEKLFANTFSASPAGNPYLMSLQSRNSFVVRRALRVHGFSSDLVFDPAIAATLKAQLRQPLNLGANTASFEFRWKKNRTLTVTSQRDFYLWGEKDRWALDTLFLNGQNAIFKFVKDNHQPTSIAAGHGGKTRNFKSKNDPAYKYLELLQEAEFTNPRNRFLLENIRDSYQRVVDYVSREFQLRPNSMPGKRVVTEQEVQRIANWILQQELPTRYEEAFAFNILSDISSEIEDSINARNLTVPVRPKFGTLPDPKINAQTLEVPGSEERLIVLYTQLFSFIHQITKLTLRTVTISRDLNSNLTEINFSPEEAKRLIRSDPAIKADFVKVLLEFLLIAEPTQEAPLDEIYDPFVDNFERGIELFAVGHEYGHVMKKHQLIESSSFRLVPQPSDTAGPIEIHVLEASWRQEFEADSVGVELMIDALNRQEDANVIMRLYAMAAPLFFFKCMDILDETDYLLSTGERKLPMSGAEKAKLREILEGVVAPEGRKSRTKEAEGTVSSFNADNHPPPSLRGAVIEAGLTKFIKLKPENELERRLQEFGAAMISNVGLLWEDCVPDLLAVSQRSRSVEPAKRN
jgi:hypothetical protein